MWRVPIDENTSRVWHVPTDFNTTNLTCAHACQLMFTYHVPGMCLSCSATDQITEVASVLRQTSSQDRNSTLGKLPFFTEVTCYNVEMRWPLQMQFLFGELSRM